MRGLGYDREPYKNTNTYSALVGVVSQVLYYTTPPFVANRSLGHDIEKKGGSGDWKVVNVKMASIALAVTAKECPSKILQLSDLWLRAFLPYAIKSKDSEYVLLALHTLLKQEESGRVTDSKLSVKSASWLLKEDNFDASVFDP